MEAWNQSFQYPNAANIPIVAITGFEIGRTICAQMRSCPAPSIFADSTIASGTVVRKNVLHIVTLNEEHASGKISAQIVSRSPKILFTTT